MSTRSFFSLSSCLSFLVAVLATSCQSKQKGSELFIQVYQKASEKVNSPVEQNGIPNLIVRIEDKIERKTDSEGVAKFYIKHQDDAWVTVDIYANSKEPRNLLSTRRVHLAAQKNSKIREVFLVPGLENKFVQSFSNPVKEINKKNSSSQESLHDNDFFFWLSDGRFENDPIDIAIFPDFNPNIPLLSTKHTANDNLASVYLLSNGRPVAEAVIYKVSSTGRTSEVCRSSKTGRCLIPKVLGSRSDRPLLVVSSKHSPTLLPSSKILDPHPSVNLSVPGQGIALVRHCISEIFCSAGRNISLPKENESIGSSDSFGFIKTKMPSQKLKSLKSFSQNNKQILTLIDLPVSIKPSLSFSIKLLGTAGQGFNKTNISLTSILKELTSFATNLERHDGLPFKLTIDEENSDYRLAFTLVRQNKVEASFWLVDLQDDFGNLLSSKMIALGNENEEISLWLREIALSPLDKSDGSRYEISFIDSENSKLSEVRFFRGDHFLGYSNALGKIAFVRPYDSSWDELIRAIKPQFTTKNLTISELKDNETLIKMDNSDLLLNLDFFKLSAAKVIAGFELLSPQLNFLRPGLQNDPILIVDSHERITAKIINLKNSSGFLTISEDCSSPRTMREINCLETNTRLSPAGTNSSTLNLTTPSLYQEEWSAKELLFKQKNYQAAAHAFFSLLEEAREISHLNYRQSPLIAYEVLALASYFTSQNKFPQLKIQTQIKSRFDKIDKNFLRARPQFAEYIRGLLNLHELVGGQVKNLSLPPTARF